MTFTLKESNESYKSDFIDRIVHHSIVNILKPIFDKIFIVF